MSGNDQGYVKRFSGKQRFEHLGVLVLFIILAVTGLSQRFSGTGWADRLVFYLGGIDRARWIHRMSGVLFALIAASHLGAVVALTMMRKIPFSMIPSKKDFRDVVVMLRYSLWLSEERPLFDRYDYRQKFEYWGLILNGMVMILSGFILYFPIFLTAFLPGETVPAAILVHRDDGFAALMIMVAWHLYSAHLRPEIFPFDSSIFTGRISRARMEREHPLEPVPSLAAGEGAQPEARKVEIPEL